MNVWERQKTKQQKREERKNCKLVGERVDSFYRPFAKNVVDRGRTLYALHNTNTEE